MIGNFSLGEKSKVAVGGPKGFESDAHTGIALMGSNTVVVVMRIAVS
jgi:hypothetical protein